MEDEGKMRNVAIPERRIERADCRNCLQRIQHDTGEYGQSIERCGCFGGRWHNIIIDPTAPPPPLTAQEREERKRIARRMGEPARIGGRGRPRKS
jgi:hypothetical protein